MWRIAMIAKEWRGARWKLLVTAVTVVLLVFLMPTYQQIVAETVKYAPNENPVSYALRDLNDVYYLVGFFVLLPFAALLGAASISAEVSNGTILLPLSRPISRVRLLLIKYLVGAGTLMVAAVFGKLLLVAAGAVRGYPIGQLRNMEAILSVLVLWLGVLSVLEAVMNSITNGLGMRKTEIAKEPSRPWNPHFYAVFAQVHNTL
jgi:ABC-type transport system involved in multi-copper enzyme maturation permease subunit